MIAPRLLTAVMSAVGASLIATNALPAQSTATVSAAAQPAAVTAPFGVGEVLEYEINYAIIDAGTLRLAVEGIEPVDGRQAYHLVSRAQTNRTVSALYSLTDQLQSWMDVERLHALRYEKESVEKGKRRDRSYRLDQQRNVRIDLESGDEDPMPPGAQDDLSIFYFLRTLPLEEGKRLTLNVLMDPDDNPMRVTVLGEEEVKVPAGRFKTLVLQLDVETDSGVFAQGGELKVWMTDDAQRVPVKLESKLAVGSFTASLTKLTPGQTSSTAALSTTR